jgi:hypothetical protein
LSNSFEVKYNGGIGVIANIANLMLGHELTTKYPAPAPTVTQKQNIKLFVSFFKAVVFMIAKNGKLI